MTVFIIHLPPIGLVIKRLMITINFELTLDNSGRVHNKSFRSRHMVAWLLSGQAQNCTLAVRIIHIASFDTRHRH